MAIFETDDESLLFILERPWGPGRAWRLRDAADRRVGFVGGPLLRDGFGQPVAEVQGPTSLRPGRFLGGQDLELATFQSLENRETHLIFRPILEGQPFTKMLLLGATILMP